MLEKIYCFYQFFEHQYNVSLPVQYFGCKNKVRTLNTSFCNFFYKNVRKIILKVENGSKRPKQQVKQCFSSVYAIKSKPETEPACRNEVRCVSITGHNLHNGSLTFVSRMQSEIDSL